MIVDFPRDCDLGCNASDRKRFGCGCEYGVPWTDDAGGGGYAGTGRIWSRDRVIRARDATGEDRTCPQWFRRSPFVTSVFELQQDYAAARLGNVLETLAYATLVYLRHAVAEHTAWEAHWMATL